MYPYRPYSDFGIEEHKFRVRKSARVPRPPFGQNEPKMWVPPMPYYDHTPMIVTTPPPRGGGGHFHLNLYHIRVNCLQRSILNDDSRVDQKTPLTDDMGQLSHPKMRLIMIIVLT